MNILSLLNMIANDEVVLPAIQRDFVWDEAKTEKLMDSIMRGYPIGLALLWETYEDLQYRSFVRDFRPGQLHTFRDNPGKRRLKLVLDGQQRLQSLFIALFGTREGRLLHFDVLSGTASDDVGEERYFFDFLRPDDAVDRNRVAAEDAGAGANSDELEWLVSAPGLFRMDVRAKKELVRELELKLGLDQDHSLRLDVNLASFDEVLTKREHSLQVSTIDEACQPRVRTASPRPTCSRSSCGSTGRASRSAVQTSSSAC